MKSIVCCVTNDLNHDQRMIRICGSFAHSGRQTLLLGRKTSKSTALFDRPFEQRRLSCIFSKGKLFYIEFNLRLFFYLCFSSFDTYCAVDLDTVPAVWAAGKLKGKLLAYDAHELFPEVPELNARPFAKKIWEWVQSSMALKFSIRYTVSNSIVKYFSSMHQVEFDLIRNVPFREEEVDLQRSGLGSTKRNKTDYALYQGALNQGRGLEELIKAWTKIDDLELWIAGDGDISAQLKHLVNEKQLGGQVCFLGNLKPAELRQITYNAFIGFNLLENTSLSYYFSLANKFFDYMHAGVPSVNMNFPEYAAINSEHEIAILLDELSAESIVKAVDKLKSDSEFYCKLSRNALTSNFLYSWQREEQKLLNIYAPFD